MIHVLNPGVMFLLTGYDWQTVLLCSYLSLYSLIPEDVIFAPQCFSWSPNPAQGFRQTLRTMALLVCCSMLGFFESLRDVQIQESCRATDRFHSFFWNDVSQSFLTSRERCGSKPMVTPGLKLSSLSKELM